MNKIKNVIAKVSPGNWKALAIIIGAVCVIYATHQAYTFAAGTGREFAMGWLSLWAAGISWAIIQVRGGEFPVVERDLLFPIIALVVTYALIGSLAGWGSVAIAMVGGVIVSCVTNAGKKSGHVSCN
jgi:hypothetical protein